MRIVLLGDSHLARIQRDLPLLGGNVVNAARGGATVLDLEDQATGATLSSSDVAIVSVGTNDAAGSAVPLDVFRSTLSRTMRSFPAATWVVLAPPGVDESVPGAGGRTNAVVAEYAAAVASVAEERSALLVATPALLASLGRRAFATDGIHLSGAGYGLLLPALANVSLTAHGSSRPRE